MNFGKVNKHMVIDCDEVLVRISPKWVWKMHLPENYPIFERYLSVYEDFNLEKDYDIIMGRTNFQVYEWLKREGIDSEVSQSEMLEIKEKCLRLYDDPTFYDNLKPTALGESLATLSTNRNVEKISIVTRNLYE